MLELSCHEKDSRGRHNLVVVSFNSDLMIDIHKIFHLRSLFSFPYGICARQPCPVVCEAFVPDRPDIQYCDVGSVTASNIVRYRIQNSLQDTSIICTQIDGWHELITTTTTTATMMLMDIDEDKTRSNSTRRSRSDF